MTSYPSGLRFETVVVPTPYAVGPANVYVIPADPVTLIDCGPNTAAAEEALRHGMGALGLGLEDVRRIVVTHGHPDHYGLAPRLQERSGAEVLVGALDQAKLADVGTLALTGLLLLKTGIPSSALADMGARDRAAGDDLHPEVEGSVAVSGGARLAFDEFDLELLHLPGHTAGHICPYDRVEGVLFSGDTLLLEISPNPLLEPDPKDPGERRRSLVEYLETLDRLAATELTRVFPGHGPVIDEPHALIEEMRRHHHERVDHIAALLSTEGKSPWELALDLFPSLEGFDNFLAVSEVVAHVDLLVLDGRAVPEERDGVTYYRSAS